MTQFHIGEVHQNLLQSLVVSHAGRGLVELIGILFSLEGEGQNLAVGQVSPEGNIGQIFGDA